MKMSRDAGDLLYQTIDFARNSGYEYVTPEHLLYLLTFNRQFGQAFADCGGDVELLREQVGKFLSNAVYLTESGQEPQLTEGMNHLLAVAQSQAASSGRLSRRALSRSAKKTSAPVSSRIERIPQPFQLKKRKPAVSDCQLPPQNAIQLKALTEA